MLPQTIEQVLELERGTATGWTSDSQEAFISPYEPQQGDLDGLAAAAAQSSPAPAEPAEAPAQPAEAPA
jgi:hypothetical protein